MLTWLKSWLSSDSPEPSAPSAPETKPAGIGTSDIGFAVGAGGGSIEDAARLQYALSYVVKPGETHQIGQAVGAMGGSVAAAAVLDELVKQRAKAEE